MRTRRDRGQVVGGWTLVEYIASGGHGDVWKAKRGDVLAALKILNDGAKHYAVERFRTEVEIQRKLGDERGVLPMIDGNVPAKPSKSEPAWLALPLATGIALALERQTFAAVVSAMADIAECLASLASRNIAHRDIKPGNLYSFEGRFVVGDFGLVDFPGKPDITAPDRAVGPYAFHAPEMLLAGASADGRPADVWSFAKTLYALAAELPYPPPGELRADIEGTRVSASVTDPRARVLDRLLERCTQHDPARRPAMSEVAAELRAWVRGPPPATSPTDLRDLAEYFEPLNDLAQREAVRERELRNLAIDAFESATDQLARVKATIESAGVQCEMRAGGVDGFLESIGVDPESGTEPARNYLWGDERVLTVVAKDTAKQKYAALLSGIVVQVDREGALLIAAAHVVSSTLPIMRIFESVGVPKPSVVWRYVRTAAAGSALARQHTAEAIDGLVSHARDALIALRDRPPAGSNVSFE